jgi:XTP/dITP diphosphohydrolase
LMRFVLATANPDKVAEIAAILGDTVTLLPRPTAVPDIHETGETLVDNARLKAKALVAATGMAAVADDTGLEVDALGGAPGVHSARYAGRNVSYADNVDKLLREMDGVVPAKRLARFRTVALVAFPDGSEIVAHGVVEGWIATETRGTGGFGYDPVFVPADAGGWTFAEMSLADKNTVSHRARAFRSLASMLMDGQIADADAGC